MANPIEQIKEIADIVDLISEIIAVKRQGSSYVALCPFHNDNKPSMHISSTKGIYKCFSCGAGGDVFTFWSEYYQKDFKETLKDLAHKYGVSIEEYEQQDQKSKDEFELCLSAHKLAAEYYHQKLLADSKASQAREYLKAREISTESINKFQLGYAPSNFQEPDMLIRYLKNKLEISDDFLVKSGLALHSEKSQSYIDRFRNRLMIPIFDDRSRVVAFGARLLEKNDKAPKYINSSETIIYNKGSLLYNINQAKEFIRKEDFVILVEGYFDAISLWQASITNVVANQGTALTAKQIKLLTKFSENKKTYLCFDNDQAGANACDRSAELIDQVLGDINHEIKIICIPGDKDADDFIKHSGSNAFRELIQNAPYYIDYKLDKLYQDIYANNPQQKTKFIEAASQAIKLIPNKITRQEYVRIVSERTNIEASIIQELVNLDQNNPYSSPIKKQPTNKMTKTQNETKNIESLELELLCLFLYQKNFLEKFLQSEMQFIVPENETLLNTLIDISFENPDLDLYEAKYQLLQNKLATSNNLSKHIAELGMLLEQNHLDSDHDERYQKSILRISEFTLNKELNRLKSELKTIDDKKPEFFTKMLEKNRLESKLQRFKPANLV